MNRLFANHSARLVALCLLVVATPACAYLFGQWGGGSEPVSVRDNIRFSHNKHVVVEGLTCSDCHDGIEKSTSLDDKRFIPVEAKCMDCHEKTNSECKKCHVRPEMPTTWVDTKLPNLRFSHQNHVNRIKESGEKNACDRCHGEIKDTKKASETIRPKMFETCASCHDKTFGQDKCAQCHIKMPGWSSKPGQVYDHSADWLRRHGTVAKGGSAACSHCHQESSCAECHGRGNPARPSLLHLDRPDANFQHRGDWLTRHPIEARLDSKTCMTCHSQPNCASCHERYGLDKISNGGPSPHPPGWMVKGSGTDHGTAARRDVLSCAACHDRGAASNCVTCHKSGGPGGNPHPPGWDSKLDKNTAPACTPCHK